MKRRNSKSLLSSLVEVVPRGFPPLVDGAEEMAVIEEGVGDVGRGVDDGDGLSLSSSCRLEARPPSGGVGWRF